MYSRVFPIKWLVAMSGVAVLLSGCGRSEGPAPETHKASGSILGRNGKPYAGGGVISLKRVKDHKFSTNGEIGADGNFSLHTLFGNRGKTEGAMAGEYAVTIIPHSDDQNLAPIDLRKRYTIVPGENKLTIQLE